MTVLLGAGAVWAGTDVTFPGDETVSQQETARPGGSSPRNMTAGQDPADQQDVTDSGDTAKPRGEADRTDETSEASDAPTDTETTQPANAADCTTAHWPLDDRVRSLIFATLATGQPAEIRDALGERVGGLFVSSAAAPAVDDGTLLATIEGAERTPLVAIDEEGGRVQQLAMAPLPSAREMGASMSSEEIRATAARHGDAMRSLGITIDFAPVVDVSDTPDGHVIGDRSFSATPDGVTEAAGAFARGLADAGVVPTFKHFPGHGRASGDSHNELVTTPHIDDMDGDLAPYRELTAEMPDAAVMTGHLRVPGLTGDNPATISPEAITGLLREELGFDGLVVTDDLGGMRGVLDLHTTTGAAVLAVMAGVDMPLVPAALAGEVADALTAAVADGRLDENQVTASADRVLRARDCAT